MKKGLTSFDLKIIALIFMTIDHIAFYGVSIPFIHKYYYLGRILGRIAAPLFLFVLVQSLNHTKSKPKFLLRLFLASISVGLLNLIMSFYFPLVCPTLPGNFMFTLFYTALYIILIESIIKAYHNKKYHQVIYFILLILASILPTIFSNSINQFLYNVSGNLYQINHALKISFIPSLYEIDYKSGFIILGIILYFCQNKKKQIIAYTIFCLSLIILYFIASKNSLIMTLPLLGFNTVFLNWLQLFMILALPFMILYNKQKGPNVKWFFYIYYLIHRHLIMFIIYFLNH